MGIVLGKSGCQMTLFLVMLETDHRRGNKGGQSLEVWGGWCMLQVSLHGTSTSSVPLEMCYDSMCWLQLEGFSCEIAIVIIFKRINF